VYAIPVEADSASVSPGFFPVRADQAVLEYQISIKYQVWAMNYAYLAICFPESIEKKSGKKDGFSNFF
jgi:hypothetical protein